jgi:hypothetical protein
MDSLPLIAAVGLAFLFLNKKSSSSNSTDSKKSDKKNNTGIINVGDINYNTGSDGSKLQFKCNEYQYLKKDGTCETFWKDGITDNQVFKEIDRVKTLYFPGKPTWDSMCADKKVDFELLPNPNAQKIIKQVIFDVWKSSGVKVNMLPPTKKSPEWIKIVWKKVTAIYFDKVCGLDQT